MTLLSSPATGEAFWGGTWEGGEGFSGWGTLLDGSLTGGATGLLRGPSVWEFLIETAAWGLEEENLNDEVDEDVHDGEEEQAGTLMHGNEDATDIFFLLDWGYSIL